MSALDPGLVADSPLMRKTIDLVRRAAASTAPVLMIGEPGSGKKRLARILHDAGPRCSGPYEEMRCAGATEQALEQRLFGEPPDASGTPASDRGVLREAYGGTVVLDAIPELPPMLQARLVRVIETRQVPSARAGPFVPIDVRIVATANVDLERLVLEGRFRQDLYYGLNVISVRVPPLRERVEDVPALALAIVTRHHAHSGRPVAGIEPAAIEALCRHTWPGNVRELEDCIERALARAQVNPIGLDHLGPSLRAPDPGRAQPFAEPPATGGSLADLEQAHILRTLRSVNGNRAAAARLLNVDRKTLYRKLKRYGQPPP